MSMDRAYDISCEGVMHMDVYGEYLFIENFAAGYGIIRLTAVMCGRRPSCARVVCGAAFCGVFAFILFINIPKIIEFGAGIFFSALLVFIVFSPDHLKNELRITAVFYIVSFMTGGAAIAFIFASGCSGAVSNGIFYIGERVYFFMILGAGAAAAMISGLAGYVKRSVSRRPSMVRASIDIMGRVAECAAKIDTGNYLKEPVSGKPVSIIEKEEAYRAWGDLYREHIIDSRLRAVPYSSVGNAHGTMIAVRCDSMVIDRGAGVSPDRYIYLQNVYIGLYDGIFASDGEEERYTLLLQPSLIDERCFAL